MMVRQMSLVITMLRWCLLNRSLQQHNMRYIGSAISDSAVHDGQFEVTMLRWCLLNSPAVADKTTQHNRCEHASGIAEALLRLQAAPFA
jgi:hypothetical protein